MSGSGTGSSLREPTGFPSQRQELPGQESQMQPRPRYELQQHRGVRRLENQVALITGGDSGIGRSVAVLFAREGANVAINYLPAEQKDAEETKRAVEKEGRQCLLLPGDLTNYHLCRGIVEETVNKLGKLDILINNAARQQYHPTIESLSDQEFELTFRTNIFQMMYVTQAAIPHLRPGSTIINSTSVVAFQGNPTLVDYAATKGAILSFTRSLALNLAPRGIRVNCVAPGPIWTPLIPATGFQTPTSEFGKNTTLGRAGQPEECAPAYLLLAAKESSYVVGQTIHVNGGSIVNA